MERETYQKLNYISQCRLLPKLLKLLEGPKRLSDPPDKKIFCRFEQGRGVFFCAQIRGCACAMGPFDLLLTILLALVCVFIACFVDTSLSCQNVNQNMSHPSLTQVC